MEPIHTVTLPAGAQFEVTDKVARQMLEDLENFEPMDNFEINDVITDIF